MPPLTRPRFALKDTDGLTIVGLQADVPVERSAHPNGALFELRDPAGALERCRLLLDVAANERPDLIILPELSVPRTALQEIIDRVGQFAFSTVLLGGIEGMHPQAYAGHVAYTGEPLDIDPNAGSYVNASITVVKDDDGMVVSFRAKRLAAGIENNQVNPCLGTSAFRLLELGPRPIRLLPLICAEFRNGIWPRIRNDVGDRAGVDLVAVIQMNHDPDQAYPSVTLTEAYQTGAFLADARFVLANSATLSGASDGATYLIYPPTQLRVPAYEHTRPELWHVPRANGYAGFRLPDKSGCVWKIVVRLPHAPTDAYQAIPCRGETLRIWRPTVCSDKGGLAMGLMRTATASLLSEPWASAGTANTNVRDHLDVTHARYVLGALTAGTATSCLGWASLSSRLTWSTVEPVVKELVECSALLSAGGRDVRLTGDACNCELNGRGVALIHAPSETEALSTRFRLEYCMPPHSLPKGAVTFGIRERALGAADTRVVGERIRADRVTRGDDELQGGPRRRSDSSVDLDTLNFHSCDLSDLRGMYALAPALAEGQLARLLPEVFS